MAHKRKRSVNDSPLSVSSFGGALSTPEAQSPTPFPQNYDGSMDMQIDSTSRSSAWDFFSASRVKSGDWGNRTRKRFRDNRPDERVIHENTLNKLFSAQRNHPQASPIPSDTLIAQQLPAQTTVKSQRSTLHSFWKQLPAPPVQALTFSTPAPTVQQALHQDRCEDCDTVLQSENDSMDVDVDMDMGGAVESRPFGCSDCGKNVCGTCAVVSTKRHCLQCATSGRNSRRWW
ncbi:hypothetical protein IQ07DRAFT_381151 [Pyrenochaeta sp. DS3sAY3a]|nr:hypothetical protein IQ07DRAFT_381151 [Pyrenochaeta sp. DS3sAY3a]